MAEPAESAFTFPSFEDCHEVFNHFLNSLSKNEPVNSDWELLVEAVIKQDTIKAWRQLEALLNIDFDDFVEFYQDYEYRSTWDAHTAKLELVDEANDESGCGDDITLMWRVKFGVPLVSDREYLFTRRTQMIDGTIVILDQNADSRPEKKSVVRVSGYNCAICLRQLEGSTGIVLWMDYLTAVDLKMSIPKFLINWAASSGVKSVISSFRDAFEKYPEYKRKRANSSAV